jgi:hypothetical protein
MIFGSIGRKRAVKLHQPDRLCHVAATALAAANHLPGFPGFQGTLHSGLKTL